MDEQINSVQYVHHKDEKKKNKGDSLRLIFSMNMTYVYSATRRRKNVLEVIL